MNPLAIKGIVIIFAAFSLFGAYKGWEHRIYQQGWDARDGEAIKIERDEREKHDKDVVAAKAETEALRAKFEHVAADRAAMEKKYADLQKSHQAAARAGTERLRIAVASCSIPAGAESGSTAVAARTGAEARADLVPEDSAEILGFASDAARLVRDYGRIVDLYNAARKTCNAVTTP